MLPVGFFIVKGFAVLILYLDNTNAKDLELYAIMGEYDNTGIPLAYCLLSTASSLTPGKRKLSLTSFAKCVRDKYDVYPTFVHTDKDIAEIKASQSVWLNSKHQLCWWHLRKAINARLEKTTKLSTTPYNVEAAHAEFSFISKDFVPSGRPDHAESEDYDLLSAQNIPPPNPTPNPNALPIKIKIPLGMTFPNTQSHLELEDAPPSKSTRSFCNAEHRSHIIDMVERHLCAHPLVPGYSAPSPEGIRYWAVKEIYQYCVKNDLRECWAYMWENWYCPGRWELWARCTHEMIPILKTTMICESQ